MLLMLGNFSHVLLSCLFWPIVFTLYDITNHVSLLILHPTYYLNQVGMKEAY